MAAIQPSLSTVAARFEPDLQLARIKTIAFHSLVFLVAFLILFSRRPDAILNAQFWAEDGKYWYADAYSLGWRCLLIPVGGYLNTVSRLIGLATLLFPLAVAPLIMSLCAIFVHILPIHVFLSSRFSAIPFKIRLIGSLLYLTLPNCYELHANTTNLQWHLSLVGCLILFGRPENGWGWRVFDSLILASATLAGVLGIFLFPLAASLRWLRHDSRYNRFLIALLPGSLLQCLVMLISNSRPSAPNGATLPRLIGIVGGQVFYAPVLSMKSLLLLYLFADRRTFFSIEVAALALGLPIVIYALLRGPKDLKVFLIFAAALLVLALRNPLVIPTSSSPQWELMQFPGLGNRYYFFPMLAFLASVIWLWTGPGRARFTRYYALAILALLPIGIYRDWQHPQYKEFHFQEFAAEFERAAPGTRMTIPINPTGWQMVLVKR